MTAAMTRDAAGTLIDSAAARRSGGSKVGGKALSLSALDAAGERVPEWYVLPADALDNHLRAAGADAMVAQALQKLAAAEVSRATTGSVATMLETIIDSLTLAPELLEALDDVGQCIEGPFAVRSSAVGEDGAQHSFAGQFDTILGVRGAELAEAVRRCWRSACSARALDYRRRTGTLRDTTRLAVIVQRQITGDVSGVLFTLDPMSGDTDRFRVSACRGLGDALVSGGIDADEYLLARDGSELGASRIEREHRLLSPALLRELAALGVRLSHQAGPRDVEWTILNGELWVLQDRPVTSAVKPVVTAHRIVWDNSNIQESYCGVTTPLTFSFARDAYASVYEQTMRAVGISESTIAEHRPTLRTLLGLLQGRVYYNLNSWYRGLLLLPAFRRNKADMERMMGVEEPVDFVADEAPSFTERVVRLPRLARTLVRLLGAFATLGRDTSRFLSRVDARLRAVDRVTVARLPMNELMAMLEELRTDCMDRWTTPIINDFYVMMSVGRLRRFVVRALPHSGEGDVAVDVAMQQLLGGAAVAVSAAPAALLLQLADDARREPDVYASLHDREGAAALDAACKRSVTFAQTLHNLLDEYGDRCMGELKLESRSLRDDPAFVVRMLRNYLAQSRVAASHGEGDAPSATRAAEIAVSGQFGPFGRMRFCRALRAARSGIARRETLRLVRTRLFGVHRDIYRAVGRRLHERGRLDRPDDIFYLATDEIRADWEGTAITTALSELARSRRAEFAQYEKVTPPNRIITTGTPSETLEWQTPAVAGDTGRLLRGLGCSAGVVEGVVRIVRAPSDDLAIDGHILVAPRTDPGWAPLFPSARGIIVERGSLLSHSAVLARELRLPAVVGVSGILEKLRDGERVRIDGSAGTIERLELPCE